MLEEISYLKKLIGESNRIVAFTGAGISTDSGIPDFRGPEGIWTKNPELETLFSLERYMNDPDVRDQYWSRDGLARILIEEVQPNDGHLALGKLFEQGKLWRVITQNIDGLHQAGGVPEDNVLELHGNSFYSRCVICGDEVETAAILRGLLLRKGVREVISCRNCAGFYKQKVVFFGEELNPVTYTSALATAGDCDLLLVLGTSCEVTPASDIPEVSWAYGKPVVVINVGPVEFAPHKRELSISGSISTILQAVLEDS